MIKNLLISIFIICISSPALAFRCGSDIVGRWDTREEVQSKCGQPFKTSYNTKVNDNGVIKYGDTWFYNCGDDDFVYAVTFIDNKVFKEEPTERGTGKGQCR